MEKTNIDEFVKANFPDLEVHSSYIERLQNIASEIATEKGIYTRKIQPMQKDRQELLKEARNAGIDTKALKQLKLVIDFLDKNIVNVHDKIGEDAGDTAKAMFDQFSLPFANISGGKSVLAMAKQRHADEKKRKADKAKAAKAKLNADNKAKNDKNLKAMGGAPALADNTAKKIAQQKDEDAKAFDSAEAEKAEA